MNKRKVDCIEETEYHIHNKKSKMMESTDNQKINYSELLKLLAELFNLISIY